MPMVPTLSQDDAATHTRKRFINANEFLRANPRGTSGDLSPGAARSQAMAAAISFEKKTSGSTKGLPKQTGRRKKTSWRVSTTSTTAKKARKSRKKTTTRRKGFSIPFFGGGRKKKTRKRKTR